MAHRASGVLPLRYDEVEVMEFESADFGYPDPDGVAAYKAEWRAKRAAMGENHEYSDPEQCGEGEWKTD